MRRRTLYYPLPEALRGEAWRVGSGPPKCSPRHRTLTADLSAGASLACIRAHEMAHAAFTPANARRPRTVAEDIVQAVEDGRVNRLAVAAGVDFSAGDPQHLIDGALLSSMGDARRLTLILVAAFDAPGLAHMSSRALELGWDSEIVSRAADLAGQARANLGRVLGSRAGRPNSYARTLYVAKWLADQLAAFDDDDGEKGADDDDDPTRAPWGVLSVETPRLDISALARLRPIAEGTILRAPWRIATDGAVFRSKRVPRVGTVLCDASGSMDLSADDVAALARTIPAGIVGAYGGNYSTGVLRVLAHRGRIASAPNTYDLPGGNVVDGPALDWLARQPEPRVWISDGRVTGVGDHLDPRCDAERDRILASARIRRVPDIKAALQYFKQR